LLTEGDEEGDEEEDEESETFTPEDTNKLFSAFSNKAELNSPTKRQKVKSYKSILASPKKSQAQSKYKSVRFEDMADLEESEKIDPFSIAQNRTITVESEDPNQHIQSSPLVQPGKNGYGRKTSLLGSSLNRQTSILSNGKNGKNNNLFVKRTEKQKRSLVFDQIEKNEQNIYDPTELIDEGMSEILGISENTLGVVERREMRVKKLILFLLIF